MNKSISFAKLDYMTIKPYLTLKTTALFLAVFVFIAYVTGSVAPLVGMCMMYSVSFACYPFTISEKNSMDILYSTLPITRKNIITGRYLFALSLNLIMLLLSFFISVLFMFMFGRTFILSESLFVAIPCFLLFSVVEAIQLPLYFKFGYTKAKFLAYLPLLVFPLSVMIASNFIGEDNLLPIIENFSTWLAKNIFLASALAVIIWLGIMIFSALLSHHFYKKREL